ncbi:MAG: preprotein translocase subunit YajC [Defluviitaleaceae bacterium]|nr:preprotein translocase subunit YajC [Defluviitaleaceae bacterium]
MDFFRGSIFLTGEAPTLSQAAGEGNQTATTTNGGGNGEEAQGNAFLNPMTFILWGLIIVGMWFMLIRPQRKREKEAREMQSSLKVGESVVTTSGFYGKIVGVSDDAFLVEFGENKGVNVWVRKHDIAGVKSPTTTVTKTDTPAVEDKKDK